MWWKGGRCEGISGGGEDGCGERCEEGEKEHTFGSLTLARSARV